ncbi:GAF domain-containing protein [Nostoc sp.]|uniref:GAF domain-containing protein n=1 Tax=Nostoc sp. TaxID=1180 RepID=UPI003FA5B695
MAGRVKAIADIELKSIEPCHQDFLCNLQVRANLVVPILILRELWGLLAAHHCQGPDY